LYKGDSLWQFQIALYWTLVWLLFFINIYWNSFMCIYLPVVHGCFLTPRQSWILEIERRTTTTKMFTIWIFNIKYLPPCSRIKVSREYLYKLLWNSVIHFPCIVCCHWFRNICSLKLSGRTMRINHSA
jgi:hypothetical protein